MEVESNKNNETNENNEEYPLEYHIESANITTHNDRDELPTYSEIIQNTN